MAPNKAARAKAEHSAPAPAKNDLSLDDMLRISRQKDVNERLAQSIFGSSKDRRSSAPGSLGRRGKAASTDALPTLASRVGISKRAAKSSTNLKRDALNKSRSLASRPSPLQHHQSADPTSIAARIGRGRPAAAASAVPPAAPTAPAASYANNNNSNISIRGIAGPVAVIATNFAPGTTAADIRSAFESVSGEMLSCRLKSSSPVVTAEMILADRAGADAVIETFDNQKADGRLLRVYLQHGYVGLGASGASNENGSDRNGQSWFSRESSARESDNVVPSSNSQSGNRRVAEPEYHDGRYGFDNNDGHDEEMDVELDQPATRHQEVNGGIGSGSGRRDDRSNDYHHNSGGYRNDRDRRGGDSGRYDRGGNGSGRQARGLYSDRYGRGSYNGGGGAGAGGSGGGGGGGYNNGSGSGGGRNWRSPTLYL